MQHENQSQKRSPQSTQIDAEGSQINRVALEELSRTDPVIYAVLRAIEHGRQRVDIYEEALVAMSNQVSYLQGRLIRFEETACRPEPITSNGSDFTLRSSAPSVVKGL